MRSLLHIGVTSAPHNRVLLLIFLGLMLLEYLFHRLNHVDSHDPRETAASLAIAVCNKIFAALTAGMAAVPMLYVYRHRLFNIPLDTAWFWISLFFAVEFSYYLHHVAMHKIRWFWATHAVHHSPTRLNLSAAVRLAPGGHLTGGFLFYLPLVGLGFHPAAVVGMLGLGLIYQFFLHLSHPPHLGPLEWVMNTPRHHQVHHACNPTCIDKNFGSTLIVFDRMFGTFAEAPKDELLRFGLNNATSTNNPLRIVLRVWLQIFADALRAEGLKNRLRALFGKPA